MFDKKTHTTKQLLCSYCSLKFVTITSSHLFLFFLLSTFQTVTASRKYMSWTWHWKWKHEMKKKNFTESSFHCFKVHTIHIVNNNRTNIRESCAIYNLVMRKRIHYEIVEYNEKTRNKSRVPGKWWCGSYWCLFIFYLWVYGRHVLYSKQTNKQKHPIYDYH